MGKIIRLRDITNRGRPDIGLALAIIVQAIFLWIFCLFTLGTFK